MKVWLDNEKPAPMGWLWVKTEEQLIRVLNTEDADVTAVSLDYELDPGCGDGKSCAEMIAKGARDWAWSVKNNHNKEATRFLGIEPMLVMVHSNSPYAKKEMDRILDIARDHWVVGLRHLSAVALADILDAKQKERKDVSPQGSAG